MGITYYNFLAFLDIEISMFYISGLILTLWSSGHVDLYLAISNSVVNTPPYHVFHRESLQSAYDRLLKKNLVVFVKHAISVAVDIHLSSFFYFQMATNLFNQANQLKQMVEVIKQNMQIQCNSALNVLRGQMEKEKEQVR